MSIVFINRLELLFSSRKRNVMFDPDETGLPMMFYTTFDLMPPAPGEAEEYADWVESLDFVDEEEE